MNVRCVIQERENGTAAMHVHHLNEDMADTGPRIPRLTGQSRVAGIAGMLRRVVTNVEGEERGVCPTVGR